MDGQEFSGRVIMVTGAASGLGRAAATRLAQGGAALALADRDAAGLDTLTADLKADILALPFDVGNEEAWPDAMARIAARWGRLDALVNAAGISHPRGPVEALDTPTWCHVLNVNLEGSFLGCKHAVLAMRETGGAIVNIASILAEVADGGLPAYCASKGGVVQLTRSVALHCGTRGYRIRCNAVSPGYIDTPMNAAFDGTSPESRTRRTAMEALHPLGRFGTPGEIAELICFLVGDGASFATGAVFTADGGYTAA